MINAVQEVLYAKINGIVGLGAEVYDHVPQGQAVYPYVVIDPITTNDNSTDTENEAITATFMIHVFSDVKTSKETAEKQKLIYDNLHLATDVYPTGYLVSIVRQVSSNIFTEQDGITRHGVQVYDIVFEPPINYTY